MFSQLLSQPPTPLNKAKPGMVFPTEVESVVMKGLAKAPSDRFPDCRTFAHALADVLARAKDDAPDEGGIFARVKGLFGKKG
jgi:hypothetical protein